MKNEPKKNSSTLPLAIIVLVLIFGGLGGYWYYNYAKTSTTGKTATPTPAKTPVNAPPGAQPPNLLGSPTASVTVEEFADFQCGACASVHPTLKEVQSIYGSRIRFIFRNYPLGIPQHDKAYEAAVAVEAAGLQDRNKFWAMQDQLFTNQQAWTANPNYRQIWADYAQKIGLDVERFQNDMAGMMAKSRVDLDVQRGRGLSVNSTPTVLINGKLVTLQQITIPIMRQIIDSEIESAASRQAANANSGSAPTNAAPASGNAQ